MQTAEATNENQNAGQAAGGSGNNPGDPLSQAGEENESKGAQADRWSMQAEESAESGSLSGSVSWWARRAAALHVMAGYCGHDDDLVSEFEGRSCDFAINTAGVMGIKHTDVRDKLAVLVRYLLENRTGAGRMDEFPVLLAAGALADMVIINGRDTQLPDEALMEGMVE